MTRSPSTAPRFEFVQTPLCSVVVHRSSDWRSVAVVAAVPPRDCFAVAVAEAAVVVVVVVVAGQTVVDVAAVVPIAVRMFVVCLADCDLRTVYLGLLSDRRTWQQHQWNVNECAAPTRSRQWRATLPRHRGGRKERTPAGWLLRGGVI